MVIWFVALLGCPAPPTDVPTVGPCTGEPDGIRCDDRQSIVCALEEEVSHETCEDQCVPEVGCAACATAELPATLAIPLHAEGSPLGWVGLSFPGIGTLHVSPSAGVEVFGPTERVTDTVELPTMLYLRATDSAEGTVEFVQEGCGEPATITLIPRIDPGLPVGLLPAAPGFTPVRAVPDGGTIRVRIDPIRWPQLTHTELDLYLTEDRDAAEWAVNPTLVDVSGAPLSLSIGTEPQIIELQVEASAPPGVITRYDVVLDLNKDGVLGHLDRLDGADAAGITVMPDLSLSGPYHVQSAGISADFFRTQIVYYPIGIDTFSAPAPVVVISHGNGHDYRWYDYLGRHLASWGYVVMSHQNDTEPGVQAAATTTLDNTDLFLSDPGAVAPVLAGHIDPHQVVWIGHSRGGEGGLIAYDRLVQGESGLSTLQAADIKLISSIAPTVFTDPITANAHDRPYHQLSGSADGDVTGGVLSPLFPFPCPNCLLWRLKQANTGTQITTYIHGAIHNDFNCCGVNDGLGVSGPKIGRAHAQQITKAVYLALLESVLYGDEAFSEYLKRLPDAGFLPRPPDHPIATEYKVSLAGHGLFLDDFQTEPDPTVSSSGTAVHFTVEAYEEGILSDGDNTFADVPTDGMNGMTQSEDAPAIAARGAVFEWTDDAYWEVAVPSADLTRYRSLSLRVAQQTRHPNTVALHDELTFGIALVGEDGAVAELETAGYGGVTQPYERTGIGAGVGWANEFNTVRVKLVDFEAAYPGLDLRKIASVRLLFGPSHGSALGRVGLDDVALEIR